MNYDEMRAEILAILRRRMVAGCDDGEMGILSGGPYVDGHEEAASDILDVFKREIGLRMGER